MLITPLVDSSGASWYISCIETNFPMSNVQQSKSILAKLLATENLIVEHRSVSTASFDVHNRVLVLPIFKEMSGEVYDLMVGHEVGHALYTPDIVGSDVGIPMSYLNVVEDARIEKLMKRKFPGLSKSFYRGYSELNDKDFFEVNNKNVNKLSLIDRINLFFKIGNVNSGMFINFSDKEQTFVDAINNSETFDEVVDIARQLAEYDKEKETEEVDTASVTKSGTESGTSQVNSDNMSEGESQPEETENNFPNSSNQNSQDEDFTDENESGENESGENEKSDNLESSTDAAWNRNQQSLVSSSSQEYLYLSPPNYDWDSCVVPSDKFSTDMDSMIVKMETSSRSTYYSIHEHISVWENSFHKYKKESTKSVSYLVKEFEMKKNADEYSRSSVSKTGVINTNKLFSYKWSEDIFKRVMVTPGGKSHGLIMYLDWSGSMNSQLIGTIKQLFNLVQFCQRVQIPFEVYYFNDGNAPRDLKNISNLDDMNSNEIYISSGYHIVNMFNSKMNSKHIEQQMMRVWKLAHIINYRLDIPWPYNKYDLGSTPLNDTVFAAVHFFKKFKSMHKVDKVNTIFLTDGESNSVSFKYQDRLKLSVWMHDYILCLRDTKHNYTVTNINKGGEVYLTSNLIEYYKQVTGSNVIGFRLIDKYSARHFVCTYLQDEYRSWESVSNEWSKNKSFTSYTMGFNELYFIELTKEFRHEDDEEIDIDENASRAKIKKEFGKHMSSKMTHKIILSKFVSQIA
jgi:hypothetical protein